MAMTDFTRTDIIKGVNFFKGEIDGKHISSGTLHIEQEMNVEKGVCAGFRTVGFPTQDADLAESLCKTVKGWPITAQVTYTLDVSGKGHKMVVTGVKQISPAMPQPSASKVA